jgi:hypothetical protein
MSNLMHGYDPRHHNKSRLYKGVEDMVAANGGPESALGSHQQQD